MRLVHGVPKRVIVLVRLLRIVAASLIGAVVASGATATTGFLVLMGAQVAIMPNTAWAAVILGILLLIVFAFVFVVVFREMLGKLTPSAE